MDHYSGAETLWFQPGFYGDVFFMLFKIVLGPLGTVLAVGGLIGLVLRRKDEVHLDRLFTFWGIASVILLLLSAPKFKDTNYYYMPFLPLGAYLMFRGLWVLKNDRKAHTPSWESCRKDLLPGRARIQGGPPRQAVAASQLLRF